MNVFTVVGESACASPENFNEGLGRKIARDNAKQKIWALEGYLLRERLYSLATPIMPIDMARVAHKVNKAYCESMGDMSQPSWEDAPAWQRVSAMNRVDLHLNNSEAGPEASHASWFEEKLGDGWVYGDTKDPEAKTHPCMVPFDDLPKEQQAKDFIFRAVVHALGLPYQS